MTRYALHPGVRLTLGLALGCLVSDAAAAQQPRVHAKTGSIIANTIDPDSVFDQHLLAGNHLTSVSYGGCNTGNCSPCYTPCEPGQPAPSMDQSMVPPAMDNAFAMTPGPSVGNLPGMGGYIDSAVPFSHFRLRFDAAYNAEFPDRAEFFYAKYGIFRTIGADNDAEGLENQERELDYQEISSYLEVALSDRSSVFVEIPVRFVDPEFNDNTGGLGDINAGFKYALIAEPDHFLTFQLKGYFPSGDASRGLGTNHYSVEPGILYQRRVDNVVVLGEVRDWIAIDGTDFAGNVIRYGAGLGYFLAETEHASVVPIVEFVGWTVLDGKKYNFDNGLNDVLLGPQDADGDTIVNIKVGARFIFGPCNECGVRDETASLYLGWGHALSDQVWYEDLARAEFRVLF